MPTDQTTPDDRTLHLQPDDRGRLKYQSQKGRTINTEIFTIQHRVGNIDPNIKRLTTQRRNSIEKALLKAFRSRNFSSVDNGRTRQWEKVIEVVELQRNSSN